MHLHTHGGSCHRRGLLKSDIWLAKSNKPIKWLIQSKYGGTGVWMFYEAITL